MTLGDALYVGGFIVLPIAIVSWCLSQLRRLRNRGGGVVRKPARSDSTAEFPAIPRPDGERRAPGGAPSDQPTIGPEPVAADQAEPIPAVPDQAAAKLTEPDQSVAVRRDWAEAVRPTRGRQATPRMTAATPQRPFSPPIYAGRSAGVVLRAVPPAKRWPLAHFKAPYASTPRSSAARRRSAS